MKELEHEFKELKDDLKTILEEEPELTLLNWLYGSSLHSWALMAVQLRMHIPFIRSNKDLPAISLYTKEKRGAKWLDGQLLVNAFVESCEKPPSYACIPKYGDFKQSLDNALHARDFLAHKLGMDTTIHIQGFASTDSTESWLERFKSTEIKIVISCYRDIKWSMRLLSDITPHLNARSGVHR